MKKLIWILAAVPLIVTAVLLQYMPAKMPAHYDIAGNIDRWGSKNEKMIFPIVILLMTLMFYLFMVAYEKKANNAKSDKERAEALANAKVFRVVAPVTIGIEIVIHFFLLYKGWNAAEANVTKTSTSDMKFICILMGIMLIIVSNLMPKTKRNPNLGFRCKYTLYNDITWKKGNWFASVAMMTAGILTILTSAFASETVSLVCMIVYVLVGMAVSIVYAKKVYEEEKETENLK